MATHTTSSQDRQINQAAGLGNQIESTISALQEIIEDLDVKICDRDRQIKSLNNTINNLHAVIDSLKEAQ